MRAIILAGGKGIRLQPYTNILPKALIPLDDLPILQIILLQLRKAGVTHVTLAVCYKAQQIMRYFGDGQWLDLTIEYAFDPEFLGTAGPLALIDSFTEPSLVLNADILTTVDFSDVYQSHMRSNAIATMVLRRYHMQVPYGVVQTDLHNRVHAIVEKPVDTYIISTGIYTFHPLIRTYMSPGTSQDMPHLLGHLIEQGQMVNSYFFDKDWIDIGTPEQFRQARERFRSERGRYIPSLSPDTTYIEHGVRISKLRPEAGRNVSSNSPEMISLWR